MNRLSGHESVMHQMALEANEINNEQEPLPQEEARNAPLHEESLGEEEIAEQAERHKKEQKHIEEVRDRLEKHKPKSENPENSKKSSDTENAVSPDPKESPAPAHEHEASSQGEHPQTPREYRKMLKENGKQMWQKFQGMSPSEKGTLLKKGFFGALPGAVGVGVLAGGYYLATHPILLGQWIGWGMGESMVVQFVNELVFHGGWKSLVNDWFGWMAGGPILKDAPNYGSGGGGGAKKPAKKAANDNHGHANDNHGHGDAGHGAAAHH